MTPEETAEATAAAISEIGSYFMLDPTTYAQGAELGFQGMDFYAAGRGGALGDVDDNVVSTALIYFNPETVRAAWAGGRSVMAPNESALHWARAASTWGETHVPDDFDAARLAELAETVCDDADGADAPIFAGWRALPEPGVERPKARVIHQMNGLRELRAALHGAAVRASGLAPIEALMIRQPYMAGIFGWQDPPAADDSRRPVWQGAEDATNHAFGQALACLDEAERDEFAELTVELHAAVRPA